MIRVERIHGQVPCAVNSVPSTLTVPLAADVKITLSIDTDSKGSVTQSESIYLCVDHAVQLLHGLQEIGLV